MKKEKRKKKHCCINKITRTWLLTNANNRVPNTTTQLLLLNAVCERRGEEMATALCSPSAHPRTHKSSNKEEEEDDDDAAVQQLHDCAVLYKSLEVFI
jgi:hypothetical protein